MTCKELRLSHPHTAVEAAWPAQVLELRLGGRGSLRPGLAPPEPRSHGATVHRRVRQSSEQKKLTLSRVLQEPHDLLFCGECVRDGFAVAARMAASNACADRSIWQLFQHARTKLHESRAGLRRTICLDAC